MDPTQRETLARQFIAALPFARALGMEFVSIGDGVAEVAMPWDDRLVGDPETGVVHGGAVFALVDTASGAAVLAHPAQARRTATLGLRIDYTRPAIPGRTVIARAECYHVARTVAFVRATATDGDPRPLASAVATFTVDLGPGAGPPAGAEAVP